MDKLTTYFLIMTGLMLMFYFGGLLQDCSNDELCKNTTPSSMILNLILNPQNLQGSTLAVKIGLAMAIAAGGAAIISGFVTKNFELVATSALATYLLSLGFDFITVFIKVYSVSNELALLIFSPVIFLYLLTVYDWFRGRD